MKKTHNNTSHQQFQAYIRSESIYRNLLKTTPDAIVILDKDGDILKVNERAAELFCEDRSLMIGNSYRDYIAVDIVSDPESVFRLFDERNTFHEHLVQLKRADNSVFDAELNASFIDNQPEGFQAYILVIRDITERIRSKKEIEQSAERYANLIRIMNEGFAVIDRNTLITYINEKASEMIGRELEEIIGVSLYTFLDEDGIRIWHDNIYDQQKQNDGSSNFELALYVSDSSTVLTRVSTRNFHSETGSLLGTVAVLTDITRLRALETEIKQIEDEMITSILSQLSKREEELLNYLLSGYSWPKDKRKIARLMDVLPGTLDKFLARIKEKLQLTSLDKILTLVKSKI